jgi:tryptophan-rich sensory protein
MINPPSIPTEPTRRSAAARAAAWQTLVLTGWVLLSFSAGLFGSQFRPGEWYAALSKPAWTPPGWIFAPVWTTLYLLMGIAAWRVWREGGWTRQRLALALFVVQLLLNAAWSWIFFGLHRPGWAFTEILCLALAILLTMREFAKASRVAAGLLVPYLVWVCFALWRLNG